MYSDQPTMPSSVVILRNELTRQPASQCRSSTLTIFIGTLLDNSGHVIRGMPILPSRIDLTGEPGCCPPCEKPAGVLSRRLIDDSPLAVRISAGGPVHLCSAPSAYFPRGLIFPALAAGGVGPGSPGCVRDRRNLSWRRPARSKSG